MSTKIVKKVYGLYNTNRKITKIENLNFGLVTKSPNLGLVDKEAGLEVPSTFTYLYDIANDTVIQSEKFGNRGLYNVCPIVSPDYRNIFTAFSGYNLFLCVEYLPYNQIQPMLELIKVATLPTYIYKHYIWNYSRTFEFNLNHIRDNILNPPVKKVHTIHAKQNSNKGTTSKPKS